MQRKKVWWKRKGIMIPLGIVVLGLVAFFLFGKKGPALQNTFTVKKGEVVSEVSVTGTVVPVQNIDLAFSEGGRINHIYVGVGDKVTEGETLLTLDNSDLSAQVAQAEANVATQQANLANLEQGTRPEQIQVQRAAVAKAQQDLQNDYAGIFDILNDAYAKADDAVHNQTGPFFTNGDTPSPQLTFQISDPQVQVNVVNLRVQATNELNKWKAELAPLASDSATGTLLAALDQGQAHLSVIRSYLGSALDAVNSNSNLSDATVATYRANINVGRTNVNNSYTALSDQEQAIASQSITVQQANDQLTLDLAGSTSDQIAAQEAQVAQAKANASYAESLLAKTVLRAPFSGTVTKMNLVKGDVVAANDPAVSLIGSGKFEIEAYVAESDIAKVAIGDTATVTLDAYGNGVVFTAKVIKIDLSETVLDGVATYKTTLQFDTEDQKILPGLTANVDILNAKEESVLYVPTRDINTEGSTSTVSLVTDAKGTTKNVPIQTGLRGSDGNTEVVSGLNEGNVIISD